MYGVADTEFSALDKNSRTVCLLYTPPFRSVRSVNFYEKSDTAGEPSVQLRIFSWPFAIVGSVP